MALADVCHYHRRLRISFFLAMWMCSYIQMIDQLRLDLCELRCQAKNIQNTKLISHEKDHKGGNPFYFVSGEI